MSGHALADERIAAPERQRRRDELFALIDAVLDDPDNEVQASEAAQSAAQSLGLPWQYTPSIGHLDVCVDATKPARYVSWLPWPRRPFTSRGKTYYTVTDRYDTWRHNGNRMQPPAHSYTLR